MQNTRRTLNRRQLGVVCATALVFLGRAAVASAAAFNVSPTRIVLTPAETSVIVTLRNDSDHTLRFQLTAQTWSHDEEGRMVLGDTTDVVVYPPMVSVPAHESKRIRVGSQVAARAIEASYRLFVEELPDEGRTAATSKAIQVRTRIGIPIFLQQPKVKAQPQIDSMSVQDGQIEFSIRNTGSSHTIIQSLALRGVGANGRDLFENTATGGYLLAGKRQVFQLAFDPAQCAQTTKLMLVATTQDGTPTRSVPVSPSSCQAKAAKK